MTDIPQDTPRTAFASLGDAAGGQVIHLPAHTVCRALPRDERVVVFHAGEYAVFDDYPALVASVLIDHHAQVQARLAAQHAEDEARLAADLTQALQDEAAARVADFESAPPLAHIHHWLAARPALCATLIVVVGVAATHLVLG